MYTHRVWRKVKSLLYKVTCIDLYYDGMWLGCVSIYPREGNARYYCANGETYEFTTLKDMFTALRLLKDYCK